jgi:hypothetical protein
LGEKKEKATFGKSTGNWAEKKETFRVFLPFLNL